MPSKHLFKKKIIHVSAWARMFTQFRKPLLDGLQASGTLQIIYCPYEAEHVERLQADGYNFCFGSVSPKLSLKIIRDVFLLIIYLRKQRFDVLISHQPIGALIGIISGWISGVPCRIYSSGGLKFDIDNKNASNLLIKFFEKLLIKLSTATFLVNQEDERALRKLSLSSKIFYVGPRGGCGVDTNKFNSEQRLLMRHKARIELDASNLTHLIGYTGRCIWEKGFQEMISAAQILRQNTRLNFRFIIVGGEDHRREQGAIINLIHSHGLEEYFTFLGYKFNIDFYLAAFDIFLLPSYREGLPVSLLEALAMGLPCIASNIRGNRELISDGKSGLLVPPRNPVGLATAIENLIDRPWFAAELGENGAKVIASEYSEAKMVNNTITLLDEIIENAD